jgi:lysophospholipase L1-like esterase
MQVDDAPVLAISTRGDGPGMALLEVEAGPHRLTVSPRGDGPVRLVGVNLEKEGDGVVVDAMGVNGRTASSWLRWDEQQFREWVSRRPYDLVVLAYGTNEANDPSFSAEGYRKTLEQVLTRMRDLFPREACLLVAPADRAVHLSAQRYAVWETNGTTGAIQRELGPRFGCATWDQRGAMGGEGSSLAWWKAGLMGSDLIHLTATGYEELAKRLAGELR